MNFLNNIYTLKNRVGSKVFWTIFLAMLFSVFAVLFTDFWIDKIADSSTKTMTTSEDLMLIHQIKNYLPQAESAQRGYLLTHRKEYLIPFESSIDALLKDYHKLSVSRSMQSNTERKLMVDLLGVITSKITEMRLTISLQDENQPTEALNLLNLGQGVTDMEKINAIEDQLLKLEKNKLVRYRTERTQKTEWARALIMTSILVLVMVVITTFRSVINQIIEKDKIREQLAIENGLNEQKLIKTTRQLNTLALDAQGDIERERNKLARELHDELGSILTATKMDLFWVMKKSNDLAPEIQEKIARTIKYLDQGIQFKRQIVEALHPSMLSSFGLWPAIKNLVDDSAERNDWQLNLTMSDDLPTLNNSLGLIAYRVIQETLNNASKYAKAKSITLEILANDDHIKIEIVDDGIGVDLATIDPSTHGLSGMTHRIHAIGGRIDFESSAGKGMFTRVMLPI